MENKEIKIQCSCGEEITIDLSQEEVNWEIVEADEREMGTESLHEAELEVECGHCHQILTLTLHVWEYPEGFSNMEEILVDGGELLEERFIGDLVIGTEE